MSHTVLFLCTGNYYRSRFAEILFNALADESGLDWRAESRGLAIELGTRNVGPISPHALRGLAEREIPFNPDGRTPLQAEERDLEAASVIVAMKEAEHRRFMLERFPAWADRVDYWHVDDVEDGNPGQALAAIECGVRAMVADFGRSPRAK